MSMDEFYKMDDKAYKWVKSDSSFVAVGFPSSEHYKYRMTLSVDMDMRIDSPHWQLEIAVLNENGDLHYREIYPVYPREAQFACSAADGIIYNFSKRLKKPDDYNDNGLNYGLSTLLDSVEELREAKGNWFPGADGTYVLGGLPDKYSGKVLVTVASTGVKGDTEQNRGKAKWVCTTAINMFDRDIVSETRKMYYALSFIDTLSRSFWTAQELMKDFFGISEQALNAMSDMNQRSLRSGDESSMQEAAQNV